MIDPRTIDQTDLEKWPVLIWEGSFDGPAYRVVMVASDEDPAPRLAIEERRTDALGSARWLDVVGDADRAQVLEAALMSVSATGRPLNVPPIADLVHLVSVRGIDDTRPRLRRLDDRPPAGDVYGYRVMRGSLELDREDFAEAIRYDETTSFEVIDDRLEIAGAVEPGDEADEEIQVAFDAGAPPVYDPYRDGLAAGVEGADRVPPDVLPPVDLIKWFAGYDTGAWKRSGIMGRDGGHVRWSRHSDGHFDGADTPLTLADDVQIVQITYGDLTADVDLTAEAGQRLEVRNLRLLMDDEPRVNLKTAEVLGLDGER